MTLEERARRRRLASNMRDYILSAVLGLVCAYGLYCVGINHAYRNLVDGIVGARLPNAEEYVRDASNDDEIAQRLASELRVPKGGEVIKEALKNAGLPDLTILKLVERLQRTSVAKPVAGASSDGASLDIAPASRECRESLSNLFTRGIAFSLAGWKYDEDLIRFSPALTDGKLAAQACREVKAVESRAATARFSNGSPIESAFWHRAKAVAPVELAQTLYGRGSCQTGAEDPRCLIAARLMTLAMEQTREKVVFANLVHGGERFVVVWLFLACSIYVFLRKIRRFVRLPYYNQFQSQVTMQNSAQLPNAEESPNLLPVVSNMQVNNISAGQLPTGSIASDVTSFGGLNDSKPVLLSETILAELDRLAASNSPGAEIVARALEELKADVAVPKALDWAVTRDLQKLAKERTLLEITIGLLPAIGLIATLLGLIEALSIAARIAATSGDFRAAAIADVTSALSACFSTTLLALFSMAILSFASSLQEKNEQARVHDLEEKLLGWQAAFRRERAREIEMQSIASRARQAQAERNEMMRRLSAIQYQMEAGANLQNADLAVSAALQSSAQARHLELERLREEGEDLRRRLAESS